HTATGDDEAVHHQGAAAARQRRPAGGDGLLVARADDGVALGSGGREPDAAAIEATIERHYKTFAGFCEAHASESEARQQQNPKDATHPIPLDVVRTLPSVNPKSGTTVAGIAVMHG